MIKGQGSTFAAWQRRDERGSARLTADDFVIHNGTPIPTQHGTAAPSTAQKKTRTCGVEAEVKRNIKTQKRRKHWRQPCYEEASFEQLHVINLTARATQLSAATPQTPYRPSRRQHPNRESTASTGAYPSSCTNTRMPSATRPSHT